MKHDFIINKYGTKSYYVNGLLHREDGPAIEYIDGTKCWYLYGRLHRKNDAAIICANGYKEWWANGKYFGSDDDFYKGILEFFIKILIFS